MWHICSVTNSFRGSLSIIAVTHTQLTNQKYNSVQPIGWTLLYFWLVNSEFVYKPVHWWAITGLGKNRDVLNVRKIMLIINVDIFFLQIFSKLCIEYFCSLCKFKIPVRVVISKIPKQLLLNKPQRKLMFCKYQHVWVILRFKIAIRQSFFYIHTTFIKIINVDKKRVYYNFSLNIANVYYIYG